MKYLDYAATTPCDPRVVEAMLPYFTQHFGNPNSKHAAGQQARDAVEGARENIAGHIGQKPEEIIFTSGATEANNLAIKGVAECHDEPMHFITSSLEHKAVLEAMRCLREWGHEVTVIEPMPDGIIDPNDVSGAMRDNTVFCSIHHVNNEIGTIQPIQAIGEICHEDGVIFHTDATQSFGKMPMHIGEEIDMLSASSHKFYGPKGVGFLFCAEDVPLRCQLSGGSQESGLRGGTTNTPGIVGMASALEIACPQIESSWEHAEKLEGALIEYLRRNVPMCYVQGNLQQKVPWINNISFYGVDGGKLRDYLGEFGFFVSRSSACAVSDDASHVLKSIDVRPELEHNAIRISFGRGTTMDDVMACAEAIRNGCRSIRS